MKCSSRAEPLLNKSSFDSRPSSSTDDTSQHSSNLDYITNSLASYRTAPNVRKTFIDLDESHSSNCSFSRARRIPEDSYQKQPFRLDCGYPSHEEASTREDQSMSVYNNDEFIRKWSMKGQEEDDDETDTISHPSLIQQAALQLSCARSWLEKWEAEKQSARKSFDEDDESTCSTEYSDPSHVEERLLQKRNPSKNRESQQDDDNSFFKSVLQGANSLPYNYDEQFGESSIANDEDESEPPLVLNRTVDEGECTPPCQQARKFCSSCTSYPWRNRVLSADETYISYGDTTSENESLERDEELSDASSLTVNAEKFSDHASSSIPLTMMADPAICGMTFWQSGLEHYNGDKVSSVFASTEMTRAFLQLSDLPEPEWMPRPSPLTALRRNVSDPLHQSEIPVFHQRSSSEPVFSFRNDVLADDGDGVNVQEEEFHVGRNLGRLPEEMSDIWMCSRIDDVSTIGGEEFSGKLPSIHESLSQDADDERPPSRSRRDDYSSSTLSQRRKRRPVLSWFHLDSSTDDSTSKPNTSYKHVDVPQSVDECAPVHRTSRRTVDEADWSLDVPRREPKAQCEI